MENKENLGETQTSADRIKKLSEIINPNYQENEALDAAVSTSLEYFNVMSKQIIDDQTKNLIITILSNPNACTDIAIALTQSDNKVDHETLAWLVEIISPINSKEINKILLKAITLSDKQLEDENSVESFYDQLFNVFNTKELTNFTSEALEIYNKTGNTKLLSSCLGEMYCKLDPSCKIEGIVDLENENPENEKKIVNLLKESIKIPATNVIALITSNRFIENNQELIEEICLLLNTSNLNDIELKRFTSYLDSLLDDNEKSFDLLRSKITNPQFNNYFAEIDDLKAENRNNYKNIILY